MPDTHLLLLHDVFSPIRPPNTIVAMQDSDHWTSGGSSTCATADDADPTQPFSAHK